MTDDVQVLLQDAPATSQPPETPISANGSQEPKRRFRFTKENAREIAARGWATQRRLREERAKAKAERENPTQPTETEPGTELAIALRECSRLSLALDAKLAPLERAELSKALDRMLDRVRIIRGQPAPGTMTSRAPSPTPSTGARMLEAAGGSQVTTSVPVTRDEQE